jgi:hypothetical protein
LDRDEIGKRTAGAASVLATTRKGQHYSSTLLLESQDQRFGGSAVIERVWRNCDCNRPAVFDKKISSVWLCLGMKWVSDQKGEWSHQDEMRCSQIEKAIEQGQPRPTSPPTIGWSSN